MTDLQVLSSMATRSVLGELVRSAQPAATLEAVGGVEAERRVVDGEAVDVVVLAEAAIGRLAEAGHVDVSTRRPFARSEVVVAVRSGQEAPDVSTVDGLRSALTQAAAIGYSTGPSGTALVKLIEEWGLSDQLKDRLVQATPGVPVATLLDRGEVDLGFQQRSEFRDARGVSVLGPMPPGAEIISVFVAAVASASTRTADARALVGYLTSPERAADLRRHDLDTATE